MSPAPRLFVLLLLALALAIYVSVFPQHEDIWKSAGSILVVLALSDFLAARYLTALNVERTVTTALSVGTWNPVRLRLHNPTGMHRRVVVFDHYPQSAAMEGLPQEVSLPPQGWAEISYQICPLQRGCFQFPQVQVHVFSLLGLWKKNLLRPVRSEIHVFPNFATVMKYSLLATDQRLTQMGIRRKRRRGEGLEFHQLREYREGDPLRQIDWKASARMRKLIARDYQEERDQRVVFLIDCGRRMRAEDDRLSHFDHTLNAVLLLSHVALRQGDAVGIMTFGGPERWLSPRKSVSSINQILNTLYDLQPGLQAPDYSSAATQLVGRQSRRSLVVLITNVRDEDTDDLLPALALLRRHHLVMLASMREMALDDALDEPVKDFDSALEHAATHNYLAYRRRAHEKLSQGGVFTLDVRPDELPVHMVNRYLDIKTSGLL